MNFPYPFFVCLIIDLVFLWGAPDQGRSTRAKRGLLANKPPHSGKNFQFDFTACRHVRPAAMFVDAATSAPSPRPPRRHVRTAATFGTLPGWNGPRRGTGLSSAFSRIEEG